MRANNESKLLHGTWGPPLVGLAGTVAAMLTAFAQLDTEPAWKTVLVALGVSVIVVGIGLLPFTIVSQYFSWPRR